MAKTMHCDIVAAEKEIFSGQVEMVFAHGDMGELGIAPMHSQLITRLRPGEVRVQKPGGDEEFFYVSGGILEVQPHVVTVLADSASRAEDLDEATVLAAKEEAERLLQGKDVEMDIAKAQAQMAQAQAQLQAIAHLRRTLKKG